MFTEEDLLLELDQGYVVLKGGGVVVRVHGLALNSEKSVFSIIHIDVKLQNNDRICSFISLKLLPGFFSVGCI